MSLGDRARYSARTHVGHTRAVNEDAILSLPEQSLWVVADGMGGHEAGDYASRMICDMVATMPPESPPADRLRLLRDLIGRAHDEIRAESARRGGATIGATVVAMTMAQEHFACLWAGDSRLYRLRGGEIDMLTEDHSLVAGLVASGTLGWDEAERHPQANTITRAVGVGDALELDKVTGALAPGDRFLLCSDGLTKYATFAMLRRILSEAPIETVADRLVQLALDGGGADNISVIVVDAV
ncbi:serine/threonine-protein phosphatase [Rhodovulum sp. 12E13]|uniref:PP2C family protein-serine/threonine phosphatase n=1 Tax=Rhodovulum sp. 12E13 TaxID=2203891 RepID=UPI000E1891F5|nr:protein phosphatase 2C domain-containing protein [Rhodovulum sp. 12E13]RDC74068.1 serine/threonine-protein phosphatase [Rhodovulum sp. 12E13]